MHELGSGVTASKLYRIKAVVLAARQIPLYFSNTEDITQPCLAMDTEFAQLVSKIWESERALDALYSKAMNLKRLLRSTYPSISTLPTEVLGMIFKEAIGQSNAYMERLPSPFELDKQDCPVAAFRPELLLSHVSKHWRAVAIGMSSFWTHIHLHVKQSADLVDLYLSRSRGLPLDITFRQHFVCGVPPRQAYAADYLRVTATILNHMHICRRLEIRTNVPLPELLEGIGHVHAPLLAEVVLHHPHSGVREPTFSSSSFPALTHLELAGLISITATIPNKSLTSLTLSGLPEFGLSPASFLHLLQELQCLSRLVLVDEVVDFDHSHMSDAIEVPSLRFLALKPGPDVSRIYLTGLMEALITPALDELALDFSGVASPRELHLFLRYLMRESPRFLSLRHVTISSPFEAFDIIGALAYSAPNIENISLSRYSVGSVLAYLTHDARREAFPNLRALQFKSPQLDWDVVLSFLHKRKQAGKPLHSLRFEGFGGSKGKVLDELFRSLLEACLTI